MYVVEEHPLYALPCAGTHVIGCCAAEVSSGKTCPEKTFFFFEW